MDRPTIEFYEKNAGDYAREIDSYPTPETIQDFVCAFFEDGAPTADIGCGSGRDAEWLRSEGFAVDAYDASPQMLAAAKARHPDVSFRQATLPNLEGIEDQAFQNILCSAVLMHLSSHDLVSGCINLLRILRDDGILIVSIRGSRAGLEREDDGRLFSEINSSRLALLFASLGAELQFEHSASDVRRPMVTWVTMVFQKSGVQRTRGMFRVQEILVNDRKTSTYKLALIRSLCAIARCESEVVRWQRDQDGQDYVRVPLSSLAVWWLKYYWPFVIQNSKVRQTTGEKLAFADHMRGLPKEFTQDPQGLARLVDKIEGGGVIDPTVDRALNKIARTIRDQPVKYAGGGDRPLFAYEKNDVDRLGYVRVPVETWQDICLFGQWIDESVLIQWAKWSADKNQSLDLRLGDYVEILREPMTPERRTSDVRRMLKLGGARDEFRCVWTDKKLSMNAFDVDHVMPYSAWYNNDLWNLLPADPQVNNRKRDKIPTYQLITKRRDAIVAYWSMYHKECPHRFELQLRRSLRASGAGTDLLDSAIGGLVEVAERLARSTGLERFGG